MAFNTVSFSSTKQITRRGDSPALTALAASVAVLVADAAALAVTQAGQVIVQYDTTLTKNQIRDAINALLGQIEGTS